MLKPPAASEKHKESQVWKIDRAEHRENQPARNGAEGSVGQGERTGEQ